MTMLEDVKTHFRAREGYWFVPKAFGYGATPVTWQGWLVTIVFSVVTIAAVRLMPTPAERIVVTVALVAAFCVLVARKTDGGLRWRWGFRDDR
ncbi:hypothetical protein [Sphingomonas sp. BAUL-RG-20F-R05-02]|uniref:hypothetical protein n=1 Tax=Sphingomonas sp. BAUL-RG-20F-R05-02 TaxID=2914830 RepID=UPI001F5A67D0|nr:hypothetical protein [Sphingomonas sp. BAUL-RG-20F-R05-02]